MRSRSSALRADERGATAVEYAIVLCLVSFGASVALIALGARLVGLFHYQQTLLLLPIP